MRSATRERNTCSSCPGFTLLTFVAVLLTGVGVSSCGGQPSGDEVADSLRIRVGALERASQPRDDLHERDAVRAFYSKHPGPAWRGKRAEQVIEAIRSVERDGLTPSDYHLAQIDELVERRRKEPSAGLDADLDVLLTDAVASMVDDLRYGRVSPRSLNPAWNVDPRDQAPALDSLVVEIADDRSPAEAIARTRPQHFIYQGLVRELADLREQKSRGGWTAIASGPTLKTGARGPRVAALRRRLAASGDLRKSTSSDSSRYDETLAAAVRTFQTRHRLAENGRVDKTTLTALNVPAETRIEQVRANLERSRWVLGELKDSDEFLLVNLPAFKCYLIRDGKVAWEARTQVGQEARQTPTFRARLRTLVFNPSWTVPPTILSEDIIEGMRRGKDMIAEKHLEAFDAQGNPVDAYSIDWQSADANDFPYTLRQPPGPGAALGRIKFEFPNPYDIYLHDTPNRKLFDSQERTFSSGCIRVENPEQLATLLLQGQDSWDGAKIQETIQTGKTQHVALDRRIPVLIVYWTVTVGASGVRYGHDIYNLDPRLTAALAGGGQ